MQLFQDLTLVKWFPQSDPKKLGAHWLSATIPPLEFRPPADMQAPPPEGPVPQLECPVPECPR
eukprot:6283164-Pyramimonas_sp.AAC.1